MKINIQPIIEVESIEDWTFTAHMKREFCQKENQKENIFLYYK